MEALEWHHEKIGARQLFRVINAGWLIATGHGADGFIPDWTRLVEGAS